MSTPDNTRAFPVGHDGGHQGMTLRDYFAAKAMAALVARDVDEPNDDASYYASQAYTVADAMLAERAKATL